MPYKDAETRRAHYAANADRFRAEGAIKRKLHRDKINERNKKYQEDNREKIQASRREFREAHAAELSAKQRQYHRDNRAARLAAARAHREAHRETLRAKKKAYYAREKERLRARAKELDALNPELNRNQRKRHRERVHGISIDQTIARQNGKCAICRTSFLFVKPCIDHCHSSGRVRGMLCPQCNFGIGNFKDSPKLLRAAIKYLTAGDKQNHADCAAS